jgi:hypothetical protein
MSPQVHNNIFSSSKIFTIILRFHSMFSFSLLSSHSPNYKPSFPFLAFSFAQNFARSSLLETWGFRMTLTHSLFWKLVHSLSWQCFSQVCEKPFTCKLWMKFHQPFMSKFHPCNVQLQTPTLTLGDFTWMYLVLLKYIYLVSH